MPGTPPGPWFAVRLDPRRLAWRQPTLLLPQCAFPLGIGAVSLQQEVFMFEGQPQEQIEALMNANAEFRKLYYHHRDLDQQVNDAERGVLPIDDARLGQMKREKLALKQRLLEMYDRAN